MYFKHAVFSHKCARWGFMGHANFALATSIAEIWENED